MRVVVEVVAVLLLLLLVLLPRCQQQRRLGRLLRLPRVLLPLFCRPHLEPAAAERTQAVQQRQQQRSCNHLPVWRCQ